MRLTDGVIVVRDWTEDDLETLVELARDPETLRWTRVPEDNSVEHARELLGAAESPPTLIADAATGEIIGSGGLVGDLGDGRAELGYWVAPAHRGRGIATRLVRLLADWALGEGGYARVELHVHPENAASARVAERAGFACEGVLRSFADIKGRRSDVAMWARIASDRDG